MSTSVGTRQLGALAVRVVGVIWLIRAIGHVPTFIGLLAAKPSQFEPGNFRLVIAANVVSVLLYLAIAWLFLTKADRVAARVFPDDGTVGLAVSAEDCLAIALAVVGIWVLADAIPKVGQAAINFKYMEDSGRVYAAGSWLRGNWVVLAGGVAQIVVGFGLFIKSRYLAAVWSTFEARRAEQPPVENDGDAS